MSPWLSRAERKRARQVAAILAELEKAGTLNRLPADTAEPCEGPRQEGCLVELRRDPREEKTGPELAAFAVMHGADPYMVCLACLAVVVLEHLQELENLEREELKL